MKQNAIVTDIDNTIINAEPLFREIFNLKLKGNKRYDYFYENFDRKGVEPNHGISELISLLCEFSEYKVIFLTARSEKVRERTLIQLSEVLKYPVNSNDLFMRPLQNKMQAENFKRAVLKRLKKQYDIKLFIDDELKNCEMAKKLGITALRVV